jgi:hypothetical protein
MCMLRAGHQRDAREGARISSTTSTVSRPFKGRLAKKCRANSSYYPLHSAYPGKWEAKPKPHSYLNDAGGVYLSRFFSLFFLFFPYYFLGSCIFMYLPGKYRGLPNLRGYLFHVLHRLVYLISKLNIGRVNNRNPGNRESYSPARTMARAPPT